MERAQPLTDSNSPFRDPYADWELAYQEEIHRADEWLRASQPPLGETFKDGSQSWQKLNKGEVENEGSELDE